MATIKDIATRLGVSVSTVSKGLNGASDISEELRQMVLDTAVEMGYATKKSKKKENRKLAVFIENMEYETEDQFGYDIVLGFKQNAFRHNWDVTVIPVTPAFQLTEKYDTYMLKNGFCGAFLVGFALHDEWMQQLSHTTMPTVLFDNYIEKNPNVCYVGTDNYEGIDARWAVVCTRLSEQLQAAADHPHFAAAVKRVERALYYDYELGDDFYPQFQQNIEILQPLLEKLLA